MAIHIRADGVDEERGFDGPPMLIYVSQNPDGGITVMRLDTLTGVADVSPRDKTFARALLADAMGKLAEPARGKR